MVVQVDLALCSGCGLCIDLCPDVFTWDADGKAMVLKQESETCVIEDVADQCPMEAINV